MRVADDRARYRREAPLSPDPPRKPAAVRVYSGAGLARTLVVDLDVKRAGRRQVLADTERVLALAALAGAPALADESPSGGRHVYLPLATPRTLAELRPVVRALAATCPSMDASPMLNQATGCARPPGAAHRYGGYQRLLTAPAAAQAALERRASDSAWERLAARLAPHLPDDTDGCELPPDDEHDDTSRPAPRPLPPFYAAIALTGAYPPDRYPSGSEARLGVLRAAAAHGWTLAAVRAQMSSGAWPGLASLFARYSARSRTKELRADWAKARAYVAKSRPARERVPQSPTSEHTTHGGVDQLEQKVTSDQGTARPLGRRGTATEYQWLREWWSAVGLAEVERYPGAAGLAVRATLAALGAAAQKRGSRYVAIGTRSLSLEAGCDPTTVAAALRVLRAEPDPFVVLLEDHRGPGGDLYELRIPDRYAAAAERRRWPAGRIPGVDVVFRPQGGLGLPAYFAYRALQTGTPMLATDVEHAAGISRSATYRALDALADVGLARRVPGGWTRGRASLLAARARLGLDDVLAGLVERFRAERRRWWAVLRHVPARPATTTPDRTPHAPTPDGPSGPQPPDPWPPDDDPDDTTTPLDLLAEVLGATLVPPSDLEDLPHPVVPYQQAYWRQHSHPPPSSPATAVAIPDRGFPESVTTSHRC